MDEVLEKLESTLITRNVNSDSSGKNFESLFKNWGRLGNQEERRREILEKQKSNRQQNLDKYRGILELVQAVEASNIFTEKKVYYRPNIYVAGFNRTSPTYSNVLMLSEWMVEKPEDFEENWFVTPCPKGLRMLVVASGGITKCYTKRGHFRFECRTLLPGGNSYDGKRKQKCCVLDCFYQEKNNTMYILDLLAWNDQPMTNGETEFRHFWLQSQLAELPSMNESKRNQMSFTLLPKISCDKESINNFMSSYPAFQDNSPELDGLLFYHKKAHYVSGETPLVGWLFPYMVPEIIGSDVRMNPRFLEEKPTDYVDQATFIQKFEALNAKKGKGRSRCDSGSMDTSDSKKESSKETDSTIKLSECESTTVILASDAVETNQSEHNEEMESDSTVKDDIK